jgi:hypothetical protein
METATGELFTHLKRSNTLDGMGEVVMRLGCRLAMVESSGRGLSSRIGPLSSQAEALLRRQQMDFSDFDADWLDEEIAISDGPTARRKERGDCNLPELKASLAVREKIEDAIHASRMRDQAVIDRHPEWELRPASTLSQIIGTQNDDEVA